MCPQSLKPPLPQASTGNQQATLVGLNTATGAVIWTTQLEHTGHGSIRSVILSNSSLVATGYTACPTPGFVFIAEGEAHVWQFSLDGSLTKTVKLAVEGVSQGTKVSRSARFYISNFYRFGLTPFKGAT